VAGVTIPIEIMLRGNNHVFTDAVTHPVDAQAWTAEDVAAVLKGILRAINRAQNPGSEAAEVQLRGMNWIVHPGPGGPVIALEIHSASAVAGPVALPEATLDALVARAVASANAPGIVH
jgi:hypothetical protein